MPSVPGAPASPTQDTRSRILEAAYECVARWGLGKTTVEDVARQAGLSRATVYRYFPEGRDELLRSVVAWENARFFARLYDAVSDSDSLEEVMERGLLFAHRAVVEHEVLQRILETEPELLLPTLTVESRGTIELIAGFLEPYLARHELAPGLSVPQAAAFLARMVLSYISSPGRWDLDDPVQVSRLVRAELLGGVLPPVQPPPDR